MIVFDRGDAWQLVEQVQHARLSGELAAAWGADRFAPAGEALVLAAHRHDDGWGVWDGHPLPTQDGKPMSFLEAPVPALLPSYTACADAVAYEDTHAGLLVSMHVSGLRRRRYGLAPDSGSGATPTARSEEDRRITEFVEAEEQRQRQLQTDLELDEVVVHHEYAMLQVFDVLSLILCLTDLREPAQERVLDRAPTSPNEPEAQLTLRMLGSGRLSVSPWPFREHPIALSIPRRLLPHQHFDSTEALRKACSGAPIEQLRIELQRSAEPTDPGKPSSHA